MIRSLKMASFAIALAAVMSVALPNVGVGRAADKVARVGFVGPASSSTAPRAIVAFWERLRELGYVEGQNLIIESRLGGWPLRPAARAHGRSDRAQDRRARHL